MSKGVQRALLDVGHSLVSGRTSCHSLMSILPSTDSTAHAALTWLSLRTEQPSTDHSALLLLEKSPVPQLGHKCHVLQEAFSNLSSDVCCYLFYSHTVLS